MPTDPIILINIAKSAPLLGTSNKVVMKYDNDIIENPYITKLSTTSGFDNKLVVEVNVSVDKVSKRK